MILLEKGVGLSVKRELNYLEEQGLIQSFEVVHELAWQVMKDYFEYQGNTTITGSRDATRQAFLTGLVSDGEGWMEMIKSRNLTSHTYNELTAIEISNRIRKVYVQLFSEFQQTMEQLRSGTQLTLPK